MIPSAEEDRPLGERAIPFYYTAGGADPMQARWSYRLSQRGAAASTYGYNAAAGWAAAGSPAANPLAFQIGRVNFFRVEGWWASRCRRAGRVEDQIAARNCRSAVRAVLLGTDRTRDHPAARRG